jgi:hypothetical protein
VEGLERFLKKAQAKPYKKLFDIKGVQKLFDIKCVCCAEKPK